MNLAINNRINFFKVSTRMTYLFCFFADIMRN